MDAQDFEGLADLYQQLILDHGRKPRNKGSIECPTHVRLGHNPLCGDELTLYLSVQEGRIQQIRFEGEGCAIFTASASLMTEALQGKTVSDAMELFSKMHALLTGNLDPSAYSELGKLSVLSGVQAYPVRVKCAALPWRTLEAALSQNPPESVTTE